MMTVHCVIHRENLVAQNLSPELHLLMRAVIKCVNAFKANAKRERLFKAFCKELDEAHHVRLIFHTEVRWLSKGNCLARFVELYVALTQFLDTDDMALLKEDQAKAKVCYLADIFSKLNGLNADLQGSNKTLLDAKTFWFRCKTATAMK